MIELDWARCKLKPFAHQVDGVKALIENQCFALFDEPGAGKTKQVVDAACFLFEAGAIDTVVIVAPASVVINWASADFGEIERHAFAPSAVHVYGARAPEFPLRRGALNWVVTNYEFLREPPRLKAFIAQLKGRKAWIVLDESSRIKSWKAESTRACKAARRLCLRATILNGSPVANSPLDLFAQMDFLDARILGVSSFFHFRARYARKGGYKMKQVVGYHDLDGLNALVRPYVLRRLKKDCLDLPDKTYSVREAPLTPATWKTYRQMRDGMVAWLDGQQASVAPQAIVKLLRLSQITSGWLGGVEALEADPATPLFHDGKIDWSAAAAPKKAYEPPKEIGCEKLDALLEFVGEWLAQGVDRLIVWGRFRAELDRAQAAVEALGVRCVRVRGGQTKAEREEAISIFSSETGAGPMALFGSPQAGGLGLTLIRAATVIYLSNDYNPLTREQSEDRAHRPGQTRTVRYVDVIATGPGGQKTVDHAIVKALRAKKSLAELTTAEWRKALTEE